MRTILLLLACCLGTSLSAQWISLPFGQNRLQYQKHKWFRYESQNFVFSYTNDTEPLVKFVLPLSETDYAAIRSILEYQVRNKIEVILYADQGEYLQSNVGLTAPGVNTGGTTHLLDQKILLYFDGNHENLRRQLREGIARCILNRMLFGSNLQEIVQNSVLMQLPNWFTEGIVSFSTETWSTDLDNQLREAMLSGKYSNFFELASKQPRLAGHAFFYYALQQHGMSAVSNLLYLTRINREVETGFGYVFAANYYAVLGTQWWNYFANRYNADAKERRYPNQGEVELKLHKKHQLHSLKISPDGEKLAYVSGFKGQYEIWQYDLNKQTQKRLMRLGQKTQHSTYDETAPLIAWSKNSEQLALVYELKNQVVLDLIAVEKGSAKTQIIKDLQQVLSIEASGGDEWVLTAIQDGYSDVYLLNRGDLRAITQDYWDDLHATAFKWQGKAGILFASNRPEPSLKFAPLSPKADQTFPLGQTDIYFYDLQAKELIRLSHTPMAQELFPVGINENTVAFLSDLNGMNNRYLCTLDTFVVRQERIVRWKTGLEQRWKADSLPSEALLPELDTHYLQPIYGLRGKARPNTNYSRSILWQHSAPAANKVVDVFFKGGKYQVFVRNFQEDEQPQPPATEYRQGLEKKLNLPPNAQGINQMSLSQVSKPQNPSLPTAPRGDSAAIARELALVEAENKLDSLPPVVQAKDTGKIDIDNYLFQTEYDQPKQPTLQQKEQGSKDNSQPIQPIVLTEGEDGKIEVKKPQPDNTPQTPNATPSLIATNKNNLRTLEYQPERKIPYKNFFRLDEATLQFDNTPLFWNYDLFLGGNYRFPMLGLMFKTIFTDVFEDYRIEVGARMPLNFGGMEYFLTFHDRKRRWDKKYSFYRRGRTENYILVDTSSNTQVEARGRDLKHLVMAEFSYPLDRYQSVRLTPSFQTHRVAILAQDLNSLVVPNYTVNRLGFRAEYVYDNSLSLRLNILKGTRFRAFAEVFSPLNLGSLTSNMGFDLRHYLPIDGKSILAVRAAGASSWGKQKILYSLGGVENWLFPSTNQTIPLPDASAFMYQTVAANLRGFQNNIRNGNSYFVASAELRIPFSAYLRSGSGFVRNMQLLAFADMGTAWQGLSPFSKDNPLNTTLIDRSGPNAVSPIRVRVNYFRTPVVFSYGLGLRTIILGYFLRFDYGWGIETGQMLSPRLHVALGTDF